MGGSDILDPHNGAPLGFSNGSTEPSMGVTNGHKSAMNGSTNRDNNSTVTKSHGIASEYFGHNREEVTRLLIQALADMGYQTAADNVSRESGYELESPTVAGFRSAVLSGSWSKAEELLQLRPQIKDIPHKMYSCHTTKRLISPFCINHIPQEVICHFDGTRWCGKSGIRWCT